MDSGIDRQGGVRGRGMGKRYREGVQGRVRNKGRALGDLLFSKLLVGNHEGA